MRRITGTATALLLAAALTGCADDSGTSPGRTGGQDAAATQGVTVTGVGTSSASPDVLHATVGVEVEAEELSDAFDRASQAADRVIAELREQGVAQEDIQTRDLSVRDRHAHPEPPGAPRRQDTYVVRNLLEVTVRDVDRVGELLAAVAEAGGDATRIQGLRFALEEADAQRRQAREAAIEDARAQAEHYAELLDRELGDLVSISESGAGGIPESATGGARPAPPPVEPGRSTVSVRVQATWELD